MTLFRPAALVAALCLAGAAAPSLAADAAVAPAPGASSPLVAGIERAGADPAVRPQDDLFRAMNGVWLKTAAIPADKPEYGPFLALRDLSDVRVHGIVDAIAAQPQPAGGNEAKIRDFYAAYLDTAAIDHAGLVPLAPYLAQIAAVKTPHDVVVLMGHWQSIVDTPVGLGVQTDAHDPTVYSAIAHQGGLGMGDRDYYLQPDARFAAVRAAYARYVGRLLALSGDRRGAADADAVVALETRLAKVQWPAADTRDAVKSDNPMTPTALAAAAPGVDWAAFLEAGDMAQAPFVSVAQPSYAAAFAALFPTVPVETWKLYLRTRLLDALSGELPAGFRDARFQFHSVALTGVTQQPPRWQQAVTLLNGAMGEALGQAYVQEFFPPAAKARMVALVDNLMQAYAGSIDGLTWMSPETKSAAHAKLAKYGIKIGYPDRWRDYSGLDVKPGDPVGNDVRASRFEYLRQAARIGKPVDRAEWDMTPQTVNAYYDPSRNEIVFPAAILQPPLFDPRADDAANYGAIGAIIGHEISHGFDDQGAKYDGDGRLRDWWQPADGQAFQAITARLVAQYAAYQPLPGVHLDGQLTLGENIADLSGLQVAFKAYELSLHGRPSPVIDGRTGEQRFYEGWAQAWREKVRDARALQLATIDPHSPSAFRANGAAINSDGFHAAFATKPGDAMWKAPADRIRLW